MSNYNYGYRCNRHEYEKDISNKRNSSFAKDNYDNNYQDIHNYINYRNNNSKNLDVLLNAESQLTLAKHKKDKHSNEKEYRDDASKDNHRKKIEKDNNNSSDKSSYQD